MKNLVSVVSLSLSKACILSIFIFALLSSCENDDDTGSDCSGIECLPLATQSGAGTFGCLVNGEPYVDLTGRFNCFYQRSNESYTFSIRTRRNLDALSQMRLASEQQTISEEVVFPLNENTPGEFYAEISYQDQMEGAETTSMNDGYIFFTRFDDSENIVSGTFEFTIVDEFGNTYEVTDGRFDSFFTN